MVAFAALGVTNNIIEQGKNSTTHSNKSTNKPEKEKKYVSSPKNTHNSTRKNDASDSNSDSDGSSASNSGSDDSSDNSSLENHRSEDSSVDYFPLSFSETEELFGDAFHDSVKGALTFQERQITLGCFIHPLKIPFSRPA